MSFYLLTSQAGFNSDVAALRNLDLARLKKPRTANHPVDDAHVRD